MIVPLALYERQRPVVRSEPFVHVTARLQRRGGVINLLASAMTRLDVAALLADTVSDGTAADDRPTAAGLSHPAAHNYR